MIEVAGLATVATYPTRGDAEIARARLDSAGIEALVIADDEGGLNPGFYAHYGVRVVVREPDRAAAVAILAPADDGIVLDPQIVEAIASHARFAYPEEACGLLAGRSADVVRMVYCLTNVDHSPSRFTVAPAEHYHAWRHAERNGWEITGVFHSHPTSAAVPSPEDVAGALDPSWIYLIAGPVDDALEVRAYRIRSGVVAETAVVVPG